MKIQYKSEINNFSYGVYNYHPYWLLDYRHRPETRLYPEGNYDIKAGAKAPLKVTERNIALCKLELYMQERQLKEIDGAIIKRYISIVPKAYFKWNGKAYNMIRKPSEVFPHIWKGIK